MGGACAELRRKKGSRWEAARNRSRQSLASNYPAGRAYYYMLWFEVS